MEILLQLDSDRHVGVADWVGSEVPLHASSAGKLVLAELDGAELAAWLDANPLASFTERTMTDPETLRAELARVRRQGWAELVDELEDGLTSISVPVLSPRGSLVGIVGVSGPTFRLPRRAASRARAGGAGDGRGDRASARALSPGSVASRARRDVADDRGELLRPRPHGPVARRQIDPGHVSQLGEAADERIPLLHCVPVLL